MIKASTNEVCAKLILAAIFKHLSYAVLELGFLNVLLVLLTDYFQYKQLYQYIRDLFEAGSGTTSNTITWALLCLIHYPEVQTKFRKEINDVIGKDT